MREWLRGGLWGGAGLGEPWGAIGYTMDRGVGPCARGGLCDDHAVGGPPGDVLLGGGVEEEGVPVGDDLLRLLGPGLGRAGEAPAGAPEGDGLEGLLEHGARVLVGPLLAAVEHRDPAVLQRGGGGGAAVRVVDEEGLQEGDGGVGDGVLPQRRVEQRGHVGGVRGDAGQLLLGPGGGAGEELEEDDADGPDVGLGLCVGGDGEVDDLGGGVDDVVRGEGGGLVDGDEAGPGEVDELDVDGGGVGEVVGGEGDGGGAHVAVGDAELVAVVEGAEQLEDDPRDDVLAEHVLRHLLQALQQRGGRERLAHDDDLLPRQESVHHPHDVGVVQLLQQRHLPAQVADAHRRPLADAQRHVLAGGEVRCLPEDARRQRPGGGSHVVGARRDAVLRGQLLAQQRPRLGLLLELPAQRAGVDRVRLLQASRHLRCSCCTSFRFQLVRHCSVDLLFRNSFR